MMDADTQSKLLMWEKDLRAQIEQEISESKRLDECLAKLSNSRPAPTSLPPSSDSGPKQPSISEPVSQPKQLLLPGKPNELPISESKQQPPVAKAKQLAEQQTGSDLLKKQISVQTTKPSVLPNPAKSTTTLTPLIRC
jgi:hypothetical protein